MIARMTMAAACSALLLLGACKAEAKYTNADGEEYAASAEIDPFGGSEADPGAVSMGTGTVTLDGGDVYEGDFYDLDGDGQPDKFKPKKAGDGEGSARKPDGETWFDLDRVQGHSKACGTETPGSGPSKA
ncbi:MAG: hypothetical protein P1V81_11505 [Planctomycetota bacterium]|nr:hypothetical protein [Planctomycetota bacterium]